MDFSLEGLNELVFEHLEQSGITSSLREQLRQELCHGACIQAATESRLCRFLKDGVVTVSVSGLAGVLCTVNTEVVCTADVFELKHQIEKRVGVPCTHQRLLYKGVELREHQQFKVSPLGASVTMAQVRPEKLLVVTSQEEPPGNYLSSSAVYDPSSGSWMDLPPLQRGFASLAVLDDTIYAIGGERVGLEPVSTVEAFEVHTSNWVPIPCMSVPLRDAKIAIMDGKIFVMSEEEHYKFGWVAQVFEPSTGKWTVIPYLSTPRRRFGVAAVGGRVFVVGGEVDFSSTDSVEVFDPSIGGWAAAEPLKFPRSEPAVTVVHGNLYVVGGLVLDLGGACYSEYNAARSSVEMFDCATNQWIVMPDMNEKRFRHGLASVDSLLLAVGGQAGDRIHSSAEIFNTSSNGDDWTLLCSLARGISSVQLSVVDRLVYVGGDRHDGGPRNLFQKPDVDDDGYGIQAIDPCARTVSFVSTKPRSNVGHTKLCNVSAASSNLRYRLDRPL